MRKLSQKAVLRRANNAGWKTGPCPAYPLKQDRAVSNYFRAVMIERPEFADESREGLNMTTPVFRDSAVREIENQEPAAGRSQGAQRSVESEKHCAYNQTRERFLGSDVEAGDFSVASLDARLPSLEPKSGVGLWLVPFRGISPLSVRVPLDLIYLDRNCAVIEAVESFPFFQVSPFSPPAASVLVLPARTIESTQTQRGDQLIVCEPEEMKRRLEGLPSSKADAGAAQRAAPSQDEANRSVPGRVLQFEDRSSEKSPNQDSPIEDLPNKDRTLVQQPPEKGPVEPEMKNIKPAKSWLQRLLSPDPPEPRKTLRESLPGLAAYFWTGGVSQEHGIRDISPTGLYVFTSERWYPGTVVRMTLTDRREPTVERSITVNACVVRWGNDGVGLQIVLQNGRDRRQGQAPLVEGMVHGVDKQQVDEFIQRLRSGNG